MVLEFIMFIKIVIPRIQKEISERIGFLDIDFEGEAWSREFTSVWVKIHSKAGWLKIKHRYPRTIGEGKHQVFQPSVDSTVEQLQVLSFHGVFQLLLCHPWWEHVAWSFQFWEINLWMFWMIWLPKMPIWHPYMHSRHAYVHMFTCSQVPIPNCVCSCEHRKHRSKTRWKQRPHPNESETSETAQWHAQVLLRSHFLTCEFRFNGSLHISLSQVSKRGGKSWKSHVGEYFTYEWVSFHCQINELSTKSYITCASSYRRRRARDIACLSLLS